MVDRDEAGRFIRLLQELRSALPGDGILSATLPSAAVCYMDESSLAAFASLVNAAQLTTEIAGIWSTVANHHSPLLPPVEVPEKVLHEELRVSVQTRVEFLLRGGFPASKILLTIPGYGVSFPGATAPGDKFNSTKASHVPYSDLSTEWKNEASVDTYACSAYYVDDAEDGMGFVSFETPTTVALKSDFVRANGLGGVVFRLMEAGGAGADSLITAAFERLFLTAADRWHGEIKGRHWESHVEEHWEESDDEEGWEIEDDDEDWTIEDDEEDWEIDDEHGWEGDDEEQESDDAEQENDVEEQWSDVAVQESDVAEQESTVEERWGISADADGEAICRQEWAEEEPEGEANFDNRLW